MKRDQRYLANLDWGAPRRGHPEGTIRAHIEELERNLAILSHRLSERDRQRLLLAIHTHDTFKADAARGVAITHPQSHASLARRFLAEFVDDDDLLATVQWHDEPFAIWCKRSRNDEVGDKRFDALLEHIADWDLFLAFQIIDGCTRGKPRDPLRWFLETAGRHVASRFSLRDLF